jgi:DNA anti-recombination protein RmuC
MIMAESTTTTASSDGRLVTVADLRYEFDRERRITDAHFANILTLIELLNQRLGAVGNQFDNVDRRFEELDKKFDQRFEQLDNKLDQRIEQLDKKFEQRFEQLDNKFEERFEQLDNKLDQRFEHIGKKFDQRIDHLENKLDQRFEQVDKKSDQRFCVLEERLRFNKTLVVASLSAFASISSVIVTLLK